ncbi:hypothetical protein ACP70R_034705 [Stipagrostis hirtigluma subsp. patula]
MAVVKRKAPESCIPAAPSKCRRCAASKPGTSEGGHVTSRQKDGKKPATKEQHDHVPPASICSLISKVIGVDGLKFQGFMTCPNGTPAYTMNNPEDFMTLFGFLFRCNICTMTQMISRDNVVL